MAKFTMYHGDAGAIPLVFRRVLSKDPVDLTLATEIQVTFDGADGSYLVKKLSLSEVVLVNACQGKVSVPYTILTSPDFALADGMMVEAIITLPGEGPITVQADDFLAVLKRKAEA